MTLRWSHTVILVRDLEGMVDFYSEVLGFEVSDRGPIGGPGSPELVFMSQVDTDHHQLAFAPFRQGEEPPNSVDHIAFRVDDLDEVKAVAERLQRDGRAAKIAPVNHGNAWSVYFRDPEENGVEIFCDSPFHVQQPQLESWDLAMSEEELLARTRERFGSEPGFGPIEAYYESRARRS
jgi:catechol 2,3-dioxygenase-like lactoylglutathione lyase family enzyme